MTDKECIVMMAETNNLDTKYPFSQEFWKN